jgi:restriction system protein
MARRKGFVQSMVAAQREHERQRLARERQQMQAAKDYARAQAAYTKAQQQATAAAEKERQRLYTESRQAYVEMLNARIAEQHEELTTLLHATLAVDDYYDLEQQKQHPNIAPFDPGALGTPLPAPNPADYTIPPLSAMQKLVPGAKNRHEQQTAQARARLEEATRAHAAAEAERHLQLAALRAEYDRTIAAILARIAAENAEIDAFKAAYLAGDPEVIKAYCRFVLDSSIYPDTFPRTSRLAYVPDSKQLVIEYDLPPFDVIPTVASYKYTKSKDEISETARPAAQSKALYSSVIAQVTLRTIHELFEADRPGHIDTIVFNGMVESIDRGTGHTVRTCLVTVRTTRDTFLALNLRQVDPAACLKTLNAGVSKSPTELEPVRPVLEFSMVDRRFIEEVDVLSTLDQRLNLMDLKPAEFEHLIANLFRKMGLETRVTQSSRDGGVDCVAYDPRPILGGKVVIQAKRYKNTVEVSAVRDLFGTLQNEGASKGILVTTSGYGKAAYEFSHGKPIELLDGANLLHLLAEHAGIQAKIEIPDD